MEQKKQTLVSQMDVAPMVLVAIWQALQRVVSKPPSMYVCMYVCIYAIGIALPCMYAWNRRNSGLSNGRCSHGPCVAILQALQRVVSKPPSRLSPCCRRMRRNVDGQQATLCFDASLHCRELRKGEIRRSSMRVTDKMLPKA